MTNLDSLHEVYYSGHLAISGDGGVHTALTVDNTANERENIYYTSSSDHGVSWSDLELVSDDTTVRCNWPDIGADSTGHAYIVWYQPNYGEGEIWFATNAPVGIAEQPQQRPLGVQPLATVIRGVLFLPRDMTETAVVSDRVPRPVLLDVTGRKVIDLAPGANDVSRLAPGVYFVCSGPSAVSHQPSAVTKVVVAQ
jgi:hypothetical protein